ANRLAVWAARRFFHLPYFHARMSLDARGGGIRYRSQRRSAPHEIALEAEYEPVSQPYLAAPGSLEHWLTERYCLYARSPGGRLFRGDVHHLPWPLQRAEASFTRNDLFQPHGLSLPGPPALLHFSRRLDVVVWSLAPLETPGAGG
ncbi:MAG: DUF2071 domain-containing protein, partial [Myxococcota bacterium]